MMSKSLSEMTLEELWQLFPIQLTPQQKCWEEVYQEEENYLSSILPAEVKIHHIGSTSIHGIWAKPIIDILIEVPLDEFNTIKNLVIDHGYLCMHQDEKHISLNKGYTPEGFAEKVYHLHIKECGDIDEVYFRDYLNEHPEIAKEYEKLKLSLWKQYEHDRDGYTNCKTEFVRKYTEKAKEEMARRE